MGGGRPGTSLPILCVRILYLCLSVLAFRPLPPIAAVSFFSIPAVPGQFIFNKWKGQFSGPFLYPILVVT